jgi:hypothetical protein
MRASGIDCATIFTTFDTTAMKHDDI